MIDLRDIVKSFDGEQVVKSLTLHIKEGEFLTLLGPSGCGKTTTLRMIAGFETADSGSIFLQGENMSGKKPNQRNVNTVFQNYALFPHMNVEDNIAFGLVEKKVKKSEIHQRVNDMLKLVQLEGMNKRMPSQMSGGQKQRVAIARALVNHPKVLLLDEPLGALDLKLRKQMQVELKHLQRKLGITFVYVTHDQEEALTMSDRIAVMNGGILEQIGTPEEIYNFPATRFVADFIGESNILEGTGSDRILDLGCGFIPFPCTPQKHTMVCVRPEHIKMSNMPAELFDLKATVKEHIFVGSVTKTIVSLKNGQEIKITSQPDAQMYPVHSDVYLYWNPIKTVLLQNDTV